MLTEDDSAAAASTLLYCGDAVDDLVRAISDVGGRSHALVMCAGQYSFAGLTTLPDDRAAVAFTALMSARGRKVTLVPAVGVGDLPDVIEIVKRMSVAAPATDGGSGDSIEADQDSA